MGSNNKLFASSADRNKDPILEILQKNLPYEESKGCNLFCLEISSVPVSTSFTLPRTCLS
jgi:hypothetical protein